MSKMSKMSVGLHKCAGVCVCLVNANHDGDNGDYDDDDYNILISVQGKGAKPEC